jgi:signal transduction histidine kinase
MTTRSSVQPDLSMIRWRLTGRYALISSGVMLAFGTAMFIEVSRASSSLLREQARQLASSAASQLPLILHESEEYQNRKPNQSLAETGNLSILDPRSATLGLKKIVVFDKSLRILSQFGSMPVDLATARPRSALEQRQDLTLPQGLAYWRPVYLREEAGAESRLEGYVLSAVSTGGAEREMVRLRNGLLVGGAAGALVAALLSQWMVRTSLEPIRNQMQRLLQFTSDASHELRHPLTAIRAMIGNLREQGALATMEPTMARKIELIDQTSTEMSTLVDDLLLLTRLDRAIPEPKHWRRFDACDLVEDIVELYRDRAEAQQIKLTSSLSAPATISGNPEQIRRLVINLLVNALQFTPSGRRVEIRVRPRGHHVLIQVEDEGPGIATEYQDAVFERFWQADSSRQGSNSGLGLSIARSIAHVHGGTVEAQSAKTGGCLMAVELPAAA